MRAAVYSATHGPISVTDVADPICPDGGAVLAVRATGICRSDWHAWHGREIVALPHIGGHEYAGEIVALAPGMTQFAVGDRVTVPFVCGCGACEFCSAGDAQVCPNQLQPGFDLPGSFAEKVVVPAAAANLVHLPDSVTFPEAAALGCRFATAFRAVTVHGRPGPGQWLAVFGCGGVGLSAVMIGVALGARVIAVDVSAAALDRAKALGAEVVLDSTTIGAGPGTKPASYPELSADPGAGRGTRNRAGSGVSGPGDAASGTTDRAAGGSASRTTDRAAGGSAGGTTDRAAGGSAGGTTDRAAGGSAGSSVVGASDGPTDRVAGSGTGRVGPDAAVAVGDAVTEITGGCHVSLDALGSAATAIASVRSLRRRGRHVQVGLLHGDDVNPALPMDRVIGWELEIIGSHGMSARDYPAMLDMVVDGRLRPADLVTHTIGLDGIGEALARMDRPGSDGITVALPTG